MIAGFLKTSLFTVLAIAACASVATAESRYPLADDSGGEMLNDDELRINPHYEPGGWSPATNIVDIPGVHQDRRRRDTARFEAVKIPATLDLDVDGAGKNNDVPKTWLKAAVTALISALTLAFGRYLFR
jgi:hypothetical protein